MKKFFLFFLFFFISYAKEVIYICDDAAQWPPFVFYENNKTVGALVDIYDKIFKDINLSYKLELIPWKRCTNMVKKYKFAKKYVIFPGLYSSKRAKVLYISKPVYSTHQVIWYSKEKYSKDEIINKIKNNVNSLKICDVNGYNTQFYYTLLGVDKNKKINQEATSQCAVLKKIATNRCDIMVASKEAVLGYERIGKCDIPQNVSYVPFKKLKTSKFRLFISKDYPKAKELLYKINNALDKLDKSGEKEKIIKKWIKD